MIQNKTLTYSKNNLGSCPSLIIQNGFVHYNGPYHSGTGRWGYNTNAGLFCNDGFSLHGSNLLICNIASAQWIGVIPTCIRSK